jgi:alpha-D-xyloside xylohydrolase
MKIATRRYFMIFEYRTNVLVAHHGTETVRIESRGKNSLWVRATQYPDFTGKEWALTEHGEPDAYDEAHPAEITVSEKEPLAYGDETYEAPCAAITNGMVGAVISRKGILTFYRNGRKILREYYRYYDGTLSKESRCLKHISREYKPWFGGDYHLSVRFEANDGEKIYGMGQYQQPYMELKGCVLELMQKNSQVTVPFMLSDRGYGLLWNNPATGRVTFGKNIYEYIADATKEMNYWITAGDSPKEIIRQYTAVTGRAPMFRDDLLGLWQCKLRYRTQQEVLDVARKYRDQNIPVDVIVIDFFHWTRQGDWKFDTKYWPDPKAMVYELHAMGFQVGISVWPSVDKKSEHFGEMEELGYLMRTERGSNETYDFQGDCVEIDVTNPAARKYIWNICRKNYYDYGIDFFWLDNSEPDLTKYDFDNYRYYLGPAMECSNIYPQDFCRAFYDGEKEAGTENAVSLLRSGWAGSQKYGTLIWSGDIPSTFEALRDQVAAGLNMGLAGIPWWTTDIGGFMTDDYHDPDFIQLLLRWYEFAVFTPVLRMHGDRGPHTIPPMDDREFGGGYLYTGQDNELWSYGDEAFRIMKDQLRIRLEMKEYIRDLYREAHENGSPLMRAMFYEFPEDEKCWDLSDQYMFGSKYLVAPVLHLNEYSREVYLPAGKWTDIRNGKTCEGGRTIAADAPIASIPVFRREK